MSKRLKYNDEGCLNLTRNNKQNLKDYTLDFLEYFPKACNTYFYTN